MSEVQHTEHLATICIGSNTPEAAGKIAAAVEALGALGTVTTASAVYQVASETVKDHVQAGPAEKSGQAEPPTYLNQVLILATESDCAALAAAAKDIELRLGRTALARQRGEVPVDIDVVIFDERVVRPADFQAPYFRPGFREVVCNLCSQ